MTTQLETSIRSGTWAADNDHSQVGFAVTHLGIARKRGIFTGARARLEPVDGGGVLLTGEADSASVATNVSGLDEHLRGAEFFDAANHPVVGFAAEIDDEASDFEVEGTLTLRGVTRPVIVSGQITGPVEDAYGNVRLGIHATATIDRREWGIDWNTPIPSGGLLVSHDVDITADLEFILQ